MKILLGMPHRDRYMPVAMTDLLIKMTSAVFQQGHTLHYRPICGAMVNVARNEYLRIAYEEKYDYLFWLDDDNPVDTNTIMKLMRRQLPVVGVCVPGRRKDPIGRYRLNMFKERRRTGNFIEYERFKKIPKEPLIEVDALATSCFLMNKEAIKIMYEGYGGKPFEHKIEWYTREGVLVDIDSLGDEPHELICNDIGGDMIFSRRMRASGLKIYVDTTINSRHLVEDNEVNSKDFRE